MLPSPDNNIIIVCFKKDITDSDTLMISWNLTKNEEIRNFSTDQEFFLVNGANTKAGFLMNGHTYANFDLGLINFFFESDFISEKHEWKYFQNFGYRMNAREDLFLQNGNRVLKETYMEIETVSMY